MFESLRFAPYPPVGEESFWSEAVETPVFYPAVSLAFCKIVDTFPHPNFFAARFRSVYAQIAAAALPTRKALVQLGEWGCFLLWAHCLQAIKAV